VRSLNFTEKIIVWLNEKKERQQKVYALLGAVL